MIDAPAADRLDQLRERWRAEPSSRGFLQIAEEYRRVGRISDALALLDEGLRQQPSYLSALVAKGRCLLELGQAIAARETLERVVRQDPTQAVANKLLVRAYIEAGEPRQARERLDLYGLLHGGDPEIQELSRRITATEQGGRHAFGAAEDVFDLAPVAAPPPELALPGEERRPSAPAAAEAPPPSGFAPRSVAYAAEPAPALEDEWTSPGPEAFAIPAAPAAVTPESNGEPFAGLATPEARRRYLEALVAEGIFVFELVPGAEPPPAAAVPEPAAAAPAAPVPLWERVFEPEPEPEASAAEVFAPAVYADPYAAQAEWAPAADEPTTEPTWPELDEPGSGATEVWDATLDMPRAAAEWMAPAGEPVFEFEVEAPAAGLEQPAAGPAAPAATVTLAQLYLEQGHVEEAERILQEILSREPESRSAREALDELARRRAGAAASAAAPAAAVSSTPAAAGVHVAGLLADFQPDPARGDDSPAARKVHVLTRYLERLQRGGGPRVP